MWDSFKYNVLSTYTNGLKVAARFVPW